jgi:hypothetical protein
VEETPDEKIVRFGSEKKIAERSWQNSPSRMDEREGWGKGFLWERRKARFSLNDRVSVGLPGTPITAFATPTHRSFPFASIGVHWRFSFT